MRSTKRAHNAAFCVVGLLLIAPAVVGSWSQSAARALARASGDGIVRHERVNKVSACFAPAPLPGSYAWPIKPFDRPHPVRGNFGDPRTIFDAGLQGGLGAAGGFRFHNGVDISAPDGTAVYAVVTGRVLNVAADHVAVKADDYRRFQYWHVAPVVIAGEQVVAQETVLGFVLPPFGHIHLTEIDRGHVVNPLFPGHLFPYRDVKPPRVDHVIVTTDGRVTRPGEPLSGTVTIAAAAHDLPSITPPGHWHNAVVAPATVSWWLTSRDGSIVEGPRTPFDVRSTLPPRQAFWHVYSAGTFQNFPVAARRHLEIPGNYVFNLGQLRTQSLSDEDYVLTVKATDVCGNAGTLSVPIRIANADADRASASGRAAPPRSTRGTTPRIRGR